MVGRRWRFVVCVAVVGWTVMAAALGCADGGTPGGDSATSTAVMPPATGSSTTLTTASTTPIPFASTTAPVSTTKPPTTLALGALAPGKEYAKVPGKARVVAFTFDAAYDPKPLADILDALAAADAPATFFLTGEFIADFPDSVAKIVRAGYPVGNHSYSHPDFTTLSDAKIRSQLERTAALIADAGAADPRPLFRFPYGARDHRTLAAVGDAGYASVYWTIDTLDWKPERTSAQVEAAVLDHLQSGAIILMHVGSRQTASVLPEIIRKVRAEGYTLVALR
jgi:peptidoglycan/xylan/chitin deacetylase (PgdA/CDA1 family)